MLLAYTEIVKERGWGLNRFVDATSANAAKILGLYPQKGAIAVGSDADIVVLDPNRGRVLTAEILHESDYTPWEGWPVAAWPVLTMLRGRVVVRDGNFLGNVSDGRLMRRFLAPSVREGRAV
jgi:dihydropyrimidinase